MKKSSWEKGLSKLGNTWKWMDRENYTTFCDEQLREFIRQTINKELEEFSRENDKKLKHVIRAIEYKKGIIINGTSVQFDSGVMIGMDEAISLIEYAFNLGKYKMKQALKKRK